MFLQAWPGAGRQAPEAMEFGGDGGALKPGGRSAKNNL
jgi:hypothetical protein